MSQNWTFHQSNPYRPRNGGTVVDDTPARMHILECLDDIQDIADEIHAQGREVPERIVNRLRFLFDEARRIF